MAGSGEVLEPVRGGGVPAWVVPRQVPGRGKVPGPVRGGLRAGSGEVPGKSGQVLRGMDNPSKLCQLFPGALYRQRIPESWNIGLGGFVLEAGWDRLYF